MGEFLKLVDTPKLPKAPLNQRFPRMNPEPIQVQPFNPLAPNLLTISAGLILTPRQKIGPVSMFFIKDMPSKTSDIYAAQLVLEVGIRKGKRAIRKNVSLTKKSHHIFT